MPCDKIDCHLKIECFDAYGKFKYPPCASESAELAATDSQQTQAKIADDMVRVCGCIKADYTLDEIADIIMGWSRQLSAMR